MRRDPGVCSKEYRRAESLLKRYRKQDSAKWENMVAALNHNPTVADATKLVRYLEDQAR